MSKAPVSAMEIVAPEVRTITEEGGPSHAPTKDGTGNATNMVSNL
jgi:hypothetical protein